MPTTPTRHEFVANSVFAARAAELYYVIVNCTNPVTSAVHCRILPHAELEHGMFGMVTAFVVA